MSSLLPLSGTLVRAVLVMYDPPPGCGTNHGPVRGQLPFHFNPEQLQVTKAGSWIRDTSKRARATSMPEFSGGKPRIMTINIFFDAGDGRSDVQRNVETLLRCCVPTQESLTAKRSSPPWVRLVWGQLVTMSCVSVVTSVSATYTLFTPDGLPLRAECSVSLEEMGEEPRGQNPTSSSYDVVGSHEMVEGDSLASLAYRTYGSPNCWRAVARHNDIDDPAHIDPGRRIVLPDLVSTTARSNG
ncbi:CIS tube protein [Streptomyces vinaceus]|uniref:CIS tube protein n=1 Tax=Streptomyces vinaceus TaxID=1960 RepID=UPI00367E9F86